MKKSWISCCSRQESVTEQRPVRCRMVIVGDGACGKTCLVMRMSSGRFVDSGYMPTVYEAGVIDVCTGDETVELVVYDTAGQENYHRLRPLSYHDVDVVLICFSLTEPDSLVNVAEKWLPEIHHYCSKAPIILVGNKRDLRDTPEMETASFAPTVSSYAPTNIYLHDKFQNESQQNKTGDTFETNTFTDLESLYKSPVLNHQTVFTPLKPTYREHAPIKHSEGVLMARRIRAIAYFETSAMSGDNVGELLLATTKAAMLGTKKAMKFKPLTDTLKSWRSGPLN